MGFNLDILQKAVSQHGRIARVVIADVKGSTPRDVGASMLVWSTGQSGTIGGGALEFELAKQALTVQGSRLSSHALGPELGQCCGGAISILTEVFDSKSLPTPSNGVFARPIDTATEAPLSVQRLISDARGKGQTPATQLIDGWFIEPIEKPHRDLWIWGAGHVGRAMVHTLHPLGEFAITWIDTCEARFPREIPEGITKLLAVRPEMLVARAPRDAQHLILTYSHALDLELCHQFLCHDFDFVGLIGSKSKWARFRNRLTALGHTDGQISRITCPIGDPNLGKHPNAIAIGVGSQLLTGRSSAKEQRTIA
ncbi:xanthine dehydrogenase accessory protein XdhC [Planktotalea sp.]|uniref:xanthine dehydrogenase accessory protein XdhC n=1 Tax=Planktotalea sp. TaxID=2029877 RepID=UPI003D6B596B